MSTKLSDWVTKTIQKYVYTADRPWAEDEAPEVQVHTTGLSLYDRRARFTARMLISGEAQYVWRRVTYLHPDDLGYRMVQRIRARAHYIERRGEETMYYLPGETAICLGPRHCTPPTYQYGQLPRWSAFAR
jgi:hypothetical protein